MPSSMRVQSLAYAPYSGLGQAELIEKIPSGYSKIYVEPGVKTGSVLMKDDYLFMPDQDIVVDNKVVGRGSILIKIIEETGDHFIVKEISRSGNLLTTFRVDFIFKDSPIGKSLIVYRYAPFWSRWSSHDWMIYLGGGAGILAAGALIVYSMTRSPKTQ